MSDNAVRGWTLGNIRLFDGRAVHDRAAVTVDEDTIVNVVTGAAASVTSFDVDGNGGLLMPGLIDGHVHVTSTNDLYLFEQHGVTTVLDMGSHEVCQVRSLSDTTGMTDVRTAGPPASGPGGIHTRVLGFPADTAVTSPEDAERFVTARAGDGSDYVKIIVDPPQAPGALPADVVAALVVAAQAHGMISVAHTAAYHAVEIAVSAGVDVVTHTPLERPLSAQLVARMAANGTACIPTLTMMRAVSQLPPGARAYRPGLDMQHALRSVTQLRASGVRLLAGTDANTAAGTIANVRPGQSLHDELALLVQAGLTPLEALRSATTEPAHVFGLDDRGSVEAGKRADLLLVSGDPLTTIEDTRAIQRVWVKGSTTARRT